MSAALTIEDGEKALICFDLNSLKTCEIFNGTNSIATYSVNHKHFGGKLGFYRGKPTTVGSRSGDYYTGEGKNKVETLQSSGWSTLSDFPKRYSKKLVSKEKLKYSQ